MAGGEPVDTSGQRHYEREVRRRLRQLVAQSRLRAFFMQVTWIVILAAGAAVPLATALDWPDWAGPVLGFVVVIATGLERIFRRTTTASVAVEALRQRLDRERRRYAVGGLGGSVDEDLFERFVRRCEEAFDDFDETMLEYREQVAREPSE